MSKQPPPAPTASAVAPCPTVIQIVGRPGTGSLPSTIAPPDTSLRKRKLERKLEIDQNETQGPLMNNPMEPTYKPGPSGDNSDTNKSESTSNESSPKRRKITPVKKVKRKLVYKDPSNEVPRLTIDRHRMKIVWKKHSRE